MNPSRPVLLCVLCRSDKLERAVGLKPVPVATPNFHGASDATVPMDLMLCQACGNLQSAHMLDPEFNYRSYAYTTSSSPGLIEHFQDACAQALLRYDPPKGSLVVEIGSNDGSFLKCWKRAGLRVCGVDPAEEVAGRARRSDIPTYASFFDEKMALTIRRQVGGKAQIVLANNVLANLEDLSVITKGLKRLLTPNGVFILETQYGLDVIDKMLLDTIYPEHISYFMVKPLAEHFDKHGFQIIAVDRISSKGGSIRVAVQRKGGKRLQRPEAGLMIYEEERRGAFRKELYADFAIQVGVVRRRLGEILANEARPVIGYGASVGTTTLLAQLGLQERLSVLLDDQCQEPGQSLNGTGVSPGGSLEKIVPGTCIIFAWRYAERIISKHQDYIARGGRFVVPLPSPRVVERTAS